MISVFEHNLKLAFGRRVAACGAGLYAFEFFTRFRDVRQNYFPVQLSHAYLIGAFVHGDVLGALRGEWLALPAAPTPAQPQAREPRHQIKF